MSWDDVLYSTPRLGGVLAEFAREPTDRVMDGRDLMNRTDAGAACSWADDRRSTWKHCTSFVCPFHGEENKAANERAVAYTKTHAFADSIRTIPIAQ